MDVAAAVDVIAAAGAEAVAMGSVYGACGALQKGLNARGRYPMLASVKVRSDTPRNAGTRFTSQNGNSGIRRSTSR